jgi:hypothetical protein
MEHGGEPAVPYAVLDLSALTAPTQAHGAPAQPLCSPSAAQLYEGEPAPGALATNDGGAMEQVFTEASQKRRPQKRFDQSPEGQACSWLNSELGVMACGTKYRQTPHRAPGIAKGPRPGSLCRGSSQAQADAPGPAPPRVGHNASPSTVPRSAQHPPPEQYT